MEPSYVRCKGRVGPYGGDSHDLVSIVHDSQCVGDVSVEVGVWKGT